LFTYLKWKVPVRFATYCHPRIPPTNKGEEIFRLGQHLAKAVVPATG